MTLPWFIRLSQTTATKTMLVRWAEGKGLTIPIAPPCRVAKDPAQALRMAPDQERQREVRLVTVGNREILSPHRLRCRRDRRGIIHSLSPRRKCLSPTPFPVR